MDKKLRIGLVGSGFVADIHAYSFKHFVPNAEVVAVASLEGAGKFAKERGIPNAFNDYRQLLAMKDLDVVNLCLPNDLHCQVALDAAAAGKHIICEKPLCKTLEEADAMIAACQAKGVLLLYAEELLFAPKYVRAKTLVDEGAVGKPFLVKQSEEHSGPHMPWFWEGSLQGGGVLNDMMCHSVEVARFLLTPPGADRTVLTPVKVTAHSDCLKWHQPPYADRLAATSGGRLDYRGRPAEDFARALVEFRADDGGVRIVEATTSWCFVGAGLRLSMELLGPEYSLSVNSLDAGPRVFFSRKVSGPTGEDLVEKQNAEIGLMPVVPDEAGEYGYVAENRHMVRSFLKGVRPEESFADGVAVAELLMAAYRSAELGKTLPFPFKGLESYVPPVAQGKWNPKAK